jgi:organic hydroperoxide reductase OsmC/OhrA
MTDIVATVAWQRGAEEAFTDKRFSRGHQWSFDGGLTVRASSSPAVVPRFSDPAGVDPEEAFVASLSACHMLTFLWVAASKGFVVDSYRDEASGVMAKNAKGKVFISTVTLKPQVVFSGASQPDAGTLAAMHHAAHEDCFVANSVVTEVRVEPVA